MSRRGSRSGGSRVTQTMCGLPLCTRSTPTPGPQVQYVLTVRKQWTGAAYQAAPDSEGRLYHAQGWSMPAVGVMLPRLAVADNMASEEIPAAVQAGTSMCARCGMCVPRA